jgi:hypothetical protein
MVGTPLTLGAPPRALEGVLVLPPGARAGAVVCHPHPEYGGTMDNAVVLAVCRALAAAGRAVLRFNFGGVGRSQGAWSGGAAEVNDVGAALGALAARLPPSAPLALVGYSFGAWAALRAARAAPALAVVVAVAPPLTVLGWDFLPDVAAPVVVVAGEADHLCPPGRCAALVAAAPGRTARVTISGADHFLAGREHEVAHAVLAHVP